MNWVRCLWCGKNFLKDKRHINENKKLGHKFYCSSYCQYTAKNKKIDFICENTDCRKKSKRQPSGISPHNFCSRSCAAIINNTKFPKRIKKIIMKNCCFCKNRICKNRKYCSVKCKSDALTISKQGVIDRIKNFYKQYGRIPVKREMEGIYHPARKYFLTWNYAIEAAGFKPNPIMFADKCIAKDGHICDSLAEKLIDDYLYSKNIQHQRCIPYPKSEYTADFKIGDTFIEYFGLSGEHKRYDEIRTIKQGIAVKYKLQLVEIYPKDLYPHNKLEAILGY